MNNNRPYYLIAALLSFALSQYCAAQGFQVISSEFTEFTNAARYFDNSIIVTGKGTGDARLQKVSATGQLLWQTNAGLGAGTVTDLTVLQDGSALVLAQNAINNGNTLAKVDASGNFQWATPLSNVLMPNGLKHIVAGNNTFYACGETQTVNGHTAIRLVRLDTDGNIIWDKTLGEPALDEQTAGLAMLPDGSLAIGGIVRQGTSTDFFLTRVDADGNTIWLKNYPQAGRQVGYDLMVTYDGQIALLGYQLQVNPNEICLLKVTANEGLLLWNRIFFLEGGYDNTISAVAQKMTQDQRGHFFMPVVTGPSNAGKGRILHLDESGLMAEFVDLPALSLLNDIVAAPGGDLIICGADNNQEGYVVKADPKGAVLPNRIAGGLFADANKNCVFTGGELPLKGWVVEARPEAGESRYAATDTFGQFILSVGEGTFTLIAHSPSGQIPFWEACNTPVINFIPGTLSAANIGFMGVQPLADCPLMEVNMQTGNILGCSNNQWRVRYINAGATDAANTEVRIIKSPFADYTGSSIPLFAQIADTLIFHPGPVKAGTRDEFTIEMFVSCDAAAGSAICTEAKITPDENCIPEQPVWDGSFIEVSETCTAPGEIQFKISNTGTGKMLSDLEYVIIEDQIILFTGSFRLDEGEDTLIVINNPSGNAYWMRAGQSEGLSILDQPTAFLDNCNNPVDYDSLQVQLPNNENDLFRSVHCGLVHATLNSGTAWLEGYPFGWRALHQIDNDQEIEYIIHFQNNTNENVNIVTVHDSLPANLLDVSTLKPGASGSPYEWTVSNEGLLYFRMADVGLEPGDQGFVSFSITPRAGLSPGTFIPNKAAVRFDYSPRTVTNETFHTIGEPLFPTVSIPIPGQPAYNVTVTPNPFTDGGILQINGFEGKGPVDISIANLTGGIVKTDQFTGQEYPLDGQVLFPGIYFFKLSQFGRTIAAGRFVVIR